MRLDYDRVMRADAALTKERYSQVENLARRMILQTSLLTSTGVTPYSLATEAKISWFVARDVLRSLVKKGYARELSGGRFGRIP